MPPHSNTSRKGPPFGKAQASFIRETRSSIDANAKSFFKGKDWRNITPCGGRFVGGLSSSPLPLESFYVKPIACFVPHHLLPNHTPTCPHCESSSDVLTSGSMVKWIRQPKICYGVRSHRYLDTKLYYCDGCKRRFAGYDKKSLQLDAHQWAGYFPFNLSTQFAIDDELFSYIVNAGNLPTATIKKQLDRMSYQKYFSDHQYYLYLVGAKRIRIGQTVSGDKNQSRIDSHFKKSGRQETPAERHHRLAKATHERHSRELASAERSLNAGLPLHELMNFKNNRNNYGGRCTLKSIGITKLQRLLNMGLETGLEVLTCDDPAVKDSWKNIIQNKMDELRSTIRDLKDLVNQSSDSLALCSMVLEDIQPDESVQEPPPPADT